MILDDMECCPADPLLVEAWICYKAALGSWIDRARGMIDRACRGWLGTPFGEIPEEDYWPLTRRYPIGVPRFPIILDLSTRLRDAEDRLARLLDEFSLWEPTEERWIGRYYMGEPIMMLPLHCRWTRECRWLADVDLRPRTFGETMHDIWQRNRQ